MVVLYHRAGGARGPARHECRAPARGPPAGAEEDRSLLLAVVAKRITIVHYPSTFFDTVNAMSNTPELTEVVRDKYGDAARRVLASVELPQAAGGACRAPQAGT